MGAVEGAEYLAANVLDFLADNGVGEMRQSLNTLAVSLDSAVP